MTDVADPALQRLIEQVRAARADGTVLDIRGGGTKTWYGEAPQGAPLDVTGLRGISSYEPTELVVTVRAGTPLAELEAALAEKGQCLPFEPPRFSAVGVEVAECAAGALGGTAVGTGLNSPVGFGDEVAAELTALTGFAIKTADNKFTAQGTLGRMVRAHAALKTAAVTLFKIANDMRWLGSGPRTGLMEMTFPSNEPGSSIMPGKVNPTQAEAMLMVCIQIMGSDVAVQMGGAEGNFELNAFRPIIISNYLHSALIMADMSDHFREFMIEGAVVNEAQLKNNIDNSVMMVTALSPVIGYDKASVVAHYAIDHNTTLKAAALACGVDEALYDRVVVPINMTKPGSADIPAKKA